jgi:hypothetical protein
MTEEQKINIDFKNALFIKEDGTEFKFKTVKRKNKKGEIITYIYEDKYDKESQHNRSKKFYENHKEEINSKILCDICNVEIVKVNFCKHVKTKKHLKNIEIKNIINSQENNII